MRQITKEETVRSDQAPQERFRPIIVERHPCAANGRGTAKEKPQNSSVITQNRPPADSGTLTAAEALSAEFPEDEKGRADGLLVMGGNAGVKTHTERSFGLTRGVAKNLSRLRPSKSPFLVISECYSSMAEDDRFRPGGNVFYCKGVLSGRMTYIAWVQGLPVVPRHPVRRVLRQLLGVFLQRDEILEGVDAVQFAGVDQAHEQVAYLVLALRSPLRRRLAPRSGRYSRPEVTRLC
jgi:hypothetical protein